MKQGDKLYDIGAPAESFYIVKEGKIVIETVIEIETETGVGTVAVQRSGTPRKRRTWVASTAE